jgi:hypothetical protein
MPISSLGAAHVAAALAAPSFGMMVLIMLPIVGMFFLPPGAGPHPAMLGAAAGAVGLRSFGVPSWSSLVPVHKR